MRLLFVCTGNLCRSPVAEGLTRTWLAQVPAGSDLVEVLSRGTRAPVGQPMDRASAAALARLGGDPSGMQAATLTPEVAASADLVLTMTREHRRTVLGMSPRGLRRTFTLVEAADLVGTVDVRDLPALPVDERARQLGVRLDAGRAHRASTDADDIEDPVGRRPSVHDSVADTIASTLRPLLQALFPVAPERPALPPPGGLSLGARLP